MIDLRSCGLALAAIVAMNYAIPTSAETVTATYTGIINTDTVITYTPVTGQITENSNQYVGDSVTMLFSRNTSIGLYSFPGGSYILSYNAAPGMSADSAFVTIGGNHFSVGGTADGGAHQFSDYTGVGPFIAHGSGVNDVKDLAFDGPWNNADIYTPVFYNNSPPVPGASGDFAYANITAEIGNFDGVQGQFLTSNLNASFSHTTTPSDIASGTVGFIDLYSGVFDGHGGYSSYIVQDLEFIPTHVTVSGVVAVPIPAALPILGATLAGLWALGWRRRHSRPPSPGETMRRHASKHLNKTHRYSGSAIGVRLQYCGHVSRHRTFSTSCAIVRRSERNRGR
jgi:hypothetical protein